MIDTTPPPNGFSTGETYSSPLRVYWQGDRFWVYDQHGFLCSTDELQLVHAMLCHQATRPSGLRPVGARAFLFPAWADEKEAYHLSIGKAVDSARVANQAVKAKSPSKLSLEDLGL